MNVTAKPNLKLALGIPLLIFVVCLLVTFTSRFRTDPGLVSTAIIFDLLITAPLAYYFVIRKTSIPNITVARVFIIGLLLAGWLLNSGSNQLLHFIKLWVSPFIELFVLFFIGRKFYTARRQAKLSATGQPDFLELTRKVLVGFAGNEQAGNIIASEIGVLYYAFIARKRKADHQTTFTSYKGNGILLVLGTFMCLFLIETIGMHFLLMMWNRTGAYILTGLSIYTCLQLFAHIRAVKTRPTRVAKDTLEIHNGLAADASISYSTIERIELTNKIPANTSFLKMALIKGLENHNVVIYLKAPVTATMMFGIRKQTSTLLLFVDKPTDFVKILELRINTLCN